VHRRGSQSPQQFGNMDRPKHIVLSGATGFLGSHLLKTLLAREYAVTILKRSNSDTSRIEREIGRVRIIDIDKTSVAEAFSGVSTDAVVHTACSYGRQGETALDMLETNVSFGLQLFESARDAGVPQFVNTDTSLPRTLNRYALSKKQFVEWLRFETGPQKTVNLRLEQMYGPGDDNKKFLPWVLDQLFGGAKEISLTSGEQKRDFIHVNDVASLYVAVLECPMSSGFSEFDVGTGRLSTIREVVQTLRRLAADVTGSTGLPELRFGAVPYRAGELMEPDINVSATTERLGWEPEITLETGLRELVFKTYGERNGS